MMKTKIVVVFLLLAFASAALPKPVGYVNDFANLLTDKNSLENELMLYEKNTTIEIAVVTIDSLPQDKTLFEYGVEMFNEWGIGKKGEDNGILVLIAKNSTVGNRMRIELGYGIQGYITGAEAGRTLDEAMPFYGQGDYQKTAEIIIAGLKSQLKSYRQGSIEGKKNFNNFINDLLPNIPLIFFILIMIVSLASRNRCPYCLKGKLEKRGESYGCKKCGRKVKKKARYMPILIGGGSGGSGGGGGFGGGSSGGGGASR